MRRRKRYPPQSCYSNSHAAREIFDDLDVVPQRFRLVVGAPGDGRFPAERREERAENDAFMRQPGELLGHQRHAQAIGDEPDRSGFGIGFLEDPRRKPRALAGREQPFALPGMGRRGHADEELRGEVGEFDRGLFGERMVVREGGENGVVRHAFGEQIVAGKRGRQADKPEVDPAAVEGVELFVAAHVEEVQGHLRAELAEGAEGGGKQTVVEIGHVADIELGALSPVHPLHGGDALGAHREQLFGVEKEGAPFVGQGNAVVRPVQQADADLVLEIAHLPGEGGLGEPELLRGFGKAQFVGDGDEVAQVAKFHWPEHREDHS